ncbi:MAG: VOC family protein [Candidatus Eremiobacteraeota bacterium]|nr:VOC family protein [Candidatus Eremiobacteraeota bacterium]
MGNPVVHFEIVGKDANLLRKFYRDAFDWQIGAPMSGVGVPDYTMVQPNEGSGIPGGIGEAPEGYDGHVTFYVSVPNAAAALRKVESLGGKIMQGADQVPGGPIIGLFEDPDGHVVGVVQTAS